MTRQLFCVSSGRSGTFLFYKLLSLYPQVESHHEFCCTHIQKAGVLDYLGIVPSGSITWGEVYDIYRNAMLYSQASLWANSSNKDSWIIPSLYELFSEAKFLWVVRDGRKTVASYLHKLPDEVYRDEDVAILYKWLDQAGPLPIRDSEDVWLLNSPPPTKAIWWPVPHPDSPYAYDFRHKWNRFQRLCWFWREVNTVIKNSLDQIPVEQWKVVRLEDLTKFRHVYDGLAKWLGLVSTQEGYQLLSKPVNVNEPVNYNLTPEQEAFYWELCGDMHQRLGYGREGYDVQY